MNVRRLARLVVLVLLVVVLLAAGLYMLVYLYRWEWSRAVVAGLFFLSALVTFSTVLLLRGLRRLEARISHLERTRADTGDVIAAENARRAARHFEWLREPPQRLQVFIPVLLGTGVLLSFAAYVLERAAGAVAGPTLDARTERLVAPDLPLGDGGGSQPSRPPPRPTSRWRRRLGWIGGLIVAVLAVGLAVDLLGDATQSRPEIAAFPGSTRIELRVEQRGEPRPPENVAAISWAACQGRLPPGVNASSVERTGADTARLTLDHQLGELHERQFVGCLEDLTVTSVLLYVDAVEMRPPGS